MKCTADDDEIHDLVCVVKQVLEEINPDKNKPHSFEDGRFKVRHALLDEQTGWWYISFNA